MALEDATLVKHANVAFVLRALENGEEYPLRGEMLVGREVECAIPLGSGHISRYHAKINVSLNGVYVEDLGSTNGTFVNGQRTKGRVRLNVGDEVAFDDIKFRFASNASGQEGATVLNSGKRFEASNAQAPAPAQVYSPNPISTPAQPKPEVAKPQNLPSEPEPTPVINDEEQRADGTQLIPSAQLNQIVERNRSNQRHVEVGSGPRLIVMTAPLRGKVFSLVDTDNGNNWQIGRAPESEICLRDKTISIDHARISQDSGSYLLTATHARNGILINGHAIARAFLKHNDTIQMGGTEMVFKTDEPRLAKQTLHPEEAQSKAMNYTVLGISIILVATIAALFLTSGA